MNNRWRLAILLPLVLGIAGPAAAQTYRYKLSSGLFGVPDIAAAVDWGVVNNGTTAQTFVVTIYQGNIGAK